MMVLMWERHLDASPGRTACCSEPARCADTPRSAGDAGCVFVRSKKLQGAKSDLSGTKIGERAQCARAHAGGRCGQRAAAEARRAVAGAVGAVRGTLVREKELEAVGGARKTPPVRTVHTGPTGGAASWEHSRGGIRRGGFSSRVARRRLELLEKLGDGAGAGVGAVPRRRCAARPRVGRGGPP